MEIPKYEYSYKIILLGESAVGKTSFCKQYIDQYFNPLFRTTIGIEYGSKYILTEGKSNIKNIKLHIWDTAGQEMYRSITKSYYRDSAGVLLLYDITDNMSYLESKRWYNEIKRYLGENVPVVLVGNKRDLSVRRQVSREEAMEWAMDNKIKFIESCAIEYESVEETFNLLIHQINKLLDEYLERVLKGEDVNMPCGIRKSYINSETSYNSEITINSEITNKQLNNISYCGGCL